MSLLTKNGVVLCGSIVLAAAAYAGTLIYTNTRLGGASPGEQIVGKVGSFAQRSMAQYCTGVKTTPGGTLMVARTSETDPRKLGIPDGVWIDQLFKGVAPANDKSVKVIDTDFENQLGRVSPNGPPQTTIISRLGADGTFKVVAALHQTACVTVTPDGSSIFLLTALRRPQDDGSNGVAVSDRPRQGMVFRSDDQGASWHWLEQGLFPQASPEAAWSLRPFFENDREVWAWSAPGLKSSAPAPSGGDDVANASARPHSGLFYSADQGGTVTEVPSDEPLEASAGYMLAHLREGQSGPVQQNLLLLTRFVTPAGPNLAAAWITQSFDAQGSRYPIKIMTKAYLQREHGAWRVAGIERHVQYGEQVEAVDRGAGGQVFGIVRDGAEVYMAKLDPDTYWRRLHTFDEGFSWPLESLDVVRFFASTDHHQVVTLGMLHWLPRWLPSSADNAPVFPSIVHYETKDDGRTWRKLAMKRQSSVVGVDKAGDRVFWVQGDSAADGDLAIHAYSLQD